METRKIIRFLILIFAFLTVFFGYLYFDEYNKKNILSDELVLSAIENLESKGIYLEKDVVENNVPEMDIFVYDSMPDDEYYEIISSKFIDSIFGNTAMKTSFDVPDGASFGIYDKHDSTKELGRIVFSNTEMIFSFLKNSVNVSGANEPIFGGDTASVNEELKKTVESLAGSVLPKNLSYRISGVSGEDELLVITLVETVDGYDINNAYLNFVFMNNELVKIVGNWVLVSPKAVYHEQLVDGVNALYKLDLDDTSKIVSERIVYTLRKSDENKCFLVPGWEIEYKNKQGVDRRVFVDAL